MKKKLFAVATIFSLYFVFITVFTAFDNQETLTPSLTKFELSEATTLAFAPISQMGSKDSQNITQVSLRDPMPPPTKKPKPRRKKRKKR